ncbi:MAG: MarR family transcriptional regulator [Pseudomonadota bacterium]
MATVLHKLTERLSAPHSKQSLRLWLSLLSCATIIEKEIRAYLAREFQTTLPRFDVLAALDRHADGLTMSELSEHLLVSNGNVTGLVARLRDDGMVERTVSPADRRTFRVKLTEAGRKAFAEMAAAHEAHVDGLLGDLSDDDIVALLDRLGAVQGSVGRFLEAEGDA